MVEPASSLETNPGGAQDIPSWETVGTAIAPAMDFSRTRLYEQLWTRPARRPGVTVSAIAASAVIDELTGEITAFADRFLQLLSPAAWICVLRGVNPGVMSGLLGISVLNKMDEVESLTALSRAAPSTGFEFETVVRPTPSRLHALGAVLAAGDALGYVDVLRRRVSKGQSLFWEANSPIPKPFPDPSIDNSVKSYDKRAQRIGTDWHPFVQYGLPRLDRSRDHVVLFANSRGISETVGQTKSRGAIDTTLNRWNSGSATLTDRARHPLVVAAGLSSNTGSYVASAYLLSRVLASIMTYDALAQVERSGFVRLEIAPFMECLAEQIAAELEKPSSVMSASLPRSVDEALGALFDSSLTMRRGLGVAARRMEHGLLIDLRAMTSALHFGLLIDKSGGGAVNVLGLEFEPYVQDIIDSALPGNSASPYRSLRGRTLLRMGRPVTDIDAVADIGNSILLISCKAFENTAEAQKGLFTAVRSVNTRVSNALNDWDNKVKELKNNPEGDNYDFRGKRVVGMLVTPQFVYSSHAAVNRRINRSPFLQQYMSVAELRLSLANYAARN